MLFATASATGKGQGGNRVAAATRLYDWNDRSGAPRMVFETHAAPAPCFLAFAKSSRTLFVTSEMDGEGRVDAFSLKDGKLVHRGGQGSDGNAAVHASLDQSGRWLAVANYRAEHAGSDVAVVVFPVTADGTVGPVSASATHEGSGPDASRQESPHTHSVMFSPDNRLLAAIDLGTDGLWLYRFDQQTGAIWLAREVKLPAGSGPRHCVFHPSRPFAYVCGELDSTLVTLRYDSSAGTADVIDTDAATKTPHAGRNYPSGLAISPDGHYLMMANRNADTIATCWIDPETGTARLRDEVPCGGKFPRAIRLDRSGRMLAVANQKSGNVVLFERDFGTGRLTPMPHGEFALPSALDVTFLD